MRMQHHFTVPVPVDEAWRALLDPERVAPCMPGATLTEAGESGFSGSVKVKLGPVSLNYKGRGSFTEVDESARRVVIDAGGKDARGNGTASATVTAALTERSTNGDVVTDVQVDTDLKVTGKPAQFGRGLISDVGDKILGQFADCLAQRLGEESATAAESEAPPPAAEPEQPAEAAATGSVSHGQPEGVSLDGSAAKAAGGARSSRTASASAPGWRVTPPQPGAQEPQQEAIDLLETAGAPVLKRVLPAAGVVALVVAVFLLRRLRRRK